MPARRLPIGAELRGAATEFRVWAPRARSVDVVSQYGDVTPLLAEERGYFCGTAPLREGDRYRYRLDGGELYPDPASRRQPEGPHGPSEVVNPDAFRWTDGGWRGVTRRGQVIYEMHVGTFTREGTWASAARQLAELARFGITVIEMMPVADFPGHFGWGYDGVALFAPTRLYGAPDDLRAFVDRAHGVGIAVILDVVYNHLGPDGNYLGAYSPDYFTDRYVNEWGEAVNFDGPDAEPVREFFASNAAYWIDEFHMDGLRFDATQQIFDASPEHILADMARRARAAAPDRRVFLVAENEPQEARVVRPPERGGFGFDAMWNDDFHHTARVALTGRSEAYYSDYKGRPQELISAVKRGFLYQGQHYAWQRKRRGAPAWDMPPAAFVAYTQNHDQVANTARGQRLHATESAGRWRALTALLLLGPATPMLFQGQEFAASAPFVYFADHRPDLAALVSKGRREFLAQFPSIAAAEVSACVPDPGDASTFERCKLDLGERERHAEAYAFHHDLLTLRREDAVFRTQAAHGIDGAVLGPEAFVLRFFGEAGDDRLLVVNLGPDLPLSVMPEPLLAPPEQRRWEITWSTDDPRYGGCGAAPFDTDGPWRLGAHSALVLRPASRLG
ncbi:MAG TPA: malto-oligosyltrehalose trehalohydrolase [Methylomirabilota bacterium]|nr:malto-oligosyltrehalose trehalohydrolase [Methylomirabilota bacterium]